MLKYKVVKIGFLVWLHKCEFGRYSQLYSMLLAHLRVALVDCTLWCGCWHLQFVILSLLDVTFQLLSARVYILLFLGKRKANETGETSEYGTSSKRLHLAEGSNHIMWDLIITLRLPKSVMVLRVQ